MPSSISSCRRIRAEGGRTPGRARTAPAIVVLTGYASIATAVEAVRLGARHYLAKPADADEILAALLRDEPDAELDVNPEPLTVRGSSGSISRRC